MKLGYKLILGYLLVASLASFITFFALHSYQKIDESFVTLMREPVPLIKSLEDLKYSGSRIISSTSEICFILSQSSKSDKTAIIEDEQKFIDAGRETYYASIKQYGDLIDADNVNDLKFLNLIKTNGEALIQTSEQIIAMKKRNAAGDEILEKKEVFEEQERAYLQAIEDALTDEYAELGDAQRTVHETGIEATNRTLLVTFLTFIAAIVSGLFISHHISRRINKLKDASEKIGRGQLETLVGITTKDEIGDLGRAFNKMIGDLKNTRSSLAVAQNFTAKVLDSMFDFVVVVNMDLTVSQVNRAALKINGYEEHEIIGKSIKFLIGEGFSQAGFDLLRETGFVANLDKISFNKDGTLTPVSMSLSILKDEQGKELGIVCVGKDISERRRVEVEQARLYDRLESQSMRLNDIVANIQGAVWETTMHLDGTPNRFEFVSDYIETMLGYSPEDFLTKPNFWIDIIHPEDKERTFSAVLEIFKHGQRGTIDFRWIRKDGRAIWIESRNEVIFDDEGKQIGLRGVTMDITERKLAEEKLKESKEWLAAMFEASQDGILVEESEKIVFVNNRYLKMHGCANSEELIGKHISEVLTPEDNERMIEYSRKRARGEEVPTVYEYKGFGKDAGKKDFEVSISTFTSNGKFYIVSAQKDITERNLIATALESSERDYRTVFEQAHDAIIIFAPEREIVLDVNQRACDVYGFSLSEFVGMSMENLSKDSTNGRERVRETLETGEYLSFETIQLRKDGSEILLEVNASPIVYQGQKAIITINRDITERKRAEIELQESKDYLDRIINTIADPIFVSDRQHQMILVNDAFCRLSGHIREEILGQGKEELFKAEESRVFLEMDNQVFESGKETMTEMQILNPLGNHYVQIRKSLYQAQNGEKFIVGVIQDITQLKQNEEKLKIFNEKLQQSNRELQDFAYVASHDLQEPLRKVQAFADRLNSKYADVLTGTGLDYLERMRNAAQRMQILIQDLLTFSRITTKAKPFVPVDLGKITREVLSDLEVSIEQAGAIIEMDDLPEIDADPTQMRQLMQNLIGNALKFHRKDTAPIIKISAQPAKNRSNANESLCEISVEDNGIGFDEKYLDRIFTVFQRLHGRTDYEGSGVGLAVCRKIAERHHGTITAKSSPGEGAAFIFTLPFKQKNEELN